MFIQNFRPGVAERLGVGPERLQGINPRLVYCGISGFGNDGPWKDRPAFDTVSQAVTGFLRLLVNPANPRVVGPAIGDAVTGFYAAFGVVAALYEREKTGKGRLVETSMFEAMSHFNIDDFTHYLSEGEVMGPSSRPHVSQSYVFQCAGRRAGSRCTCRARPSSGRTSPRRSASPACCSGPSSRAARRGSPTTRRWSSSSRRSSPQQPRAYWEERLAALEVPHSPVYTSKEVVEGELAAHHRLVIEGEGARGTFRTIRFPVRFDGEIEDTRGAAARARAVRQRQRVAQTA